MMIITRDNKYIGKGVVHMKPKKCINTQFKKIMIIVFCICVSICICSCRKNNTQNQTKQSTVSSVKAQINNDDDKNLTEKTNYTYVGNSNTKKFHLPNCKSISQMNDENKVYLNCTRDEAIKHFKPCKRCNP